ncbi:MAG: EamA family transporter [Pseudomonadota bacterium]
MKWFDRLPDNLKGVVFLMMASVFFSLMALLIKLLGQRLNITQILLVRQLGMVALVAPAIFADFPGSLRTPRPGLHLARVGFALVAMLCGFSAVIHMPLADATAIFFAKSFFVTIFAVWVLTETVGPYRWIEMGIGDLRVPVVQKL